jgi:hypothetical protein
MLSQHLCKLHISICLLKNIISERTGRLLESAKQYRAEDSTPTQLSISPPTTQTHQQPQENRSPSPVPLKITVNSDSAVWKEGLLPEALWISSMV